MKAKLDEPDSNSTQPGFQGSDFSADLQKSKVKFDDFVPSETNQCVFVSGFDKNLAINVVSGLVAKWRSQSPLHKFSRVIYRTEPRRTGIKIVEDYEGPKDYTETVKLGGPEGRYLNMLDLPVGEKMPRAKQMSRLVEFFWSFFLRTNVIEFSEIKDFIEEVLTLMYKELFDETCFSAYGEFRFGVDAEIGRFLSDKGKSFEKWCDVTDYLLSQDKRFMAEKAQKFATPRWDFAMTALQHQQIQQKYQRWRLPDGESILTMALRQVSSRLREFPFLSKPSNVIIDYNAPLLFVEFEASDNNSSLDYLHYQSAIEASLKGACYDERRADADETSLLILNGFEHFSNEGVPPIVDGLFREAHEGGPHIIVSTSSIDVAANIAKYANASIVHSFENRLYAGKLMDAIGMSEDGLRQVLEYLDAKTATHHRIAFGMRRGFRSTFEGMFWLKS